MEPLPHHYAVKGTATADGTVSLRADDLPEIVSAPPAEFEGPGTQWSPESLLVAAVADCFILTFRAIARASDLAWTAVSCEVEGTLDREDRVMRFTRLALSAELSVPAGTDPDTADTLLHKAEANCLISNSLTARRSLETRVTTPD